MASKRNPIEHGFRPVTPKNFVQKDYLRAIRANTITFGIGSAGTGKTYIPTMYAAEQLFHRSINKIIITRPNVETGKSLGYLPGELSDKFSPYLEPFEDIFKSSLGTGFYDYAVKKGQIAAKPLGYMRGATFDNCIVLADEMQNASRAEMLMLLTRVGKYTKLIVSGDIGQSDIKNDGLSDAITRLQNIPAVEVIKFFPSDIVRSKICEQIILAYST